jgi:predicted component of type VI protein secretion system
MKCLPYLPAAAILMLSTAVIAQDATPPSATQPSPPAVTEPAPSPVETPAATQAPADMTAPAADTASSPIMTDDQAKAMKNKVVWSSDEKNVGEVAEIVRDSDGRVKELHADIGGFLGFGETRVRIAPDEFKILDDRIVLTRTQAQVKTLPKVIAN